jgi:NAD(P)H-dependent flavin oxidoreductase YrpB (nitropropane dioxygenase family)
MLQLKNWQKALDEGNADSGVIACGQCVGLIHEIKMVKEVIEDTVRDAQTLIERLSSLIRKEP